MQIYYLFTQKNRNPIDQYLALWGKIHAGRILPVTYESLVRKKTFPPGLYIFSDIELLKGPARERVIAIHQTLSGDQVKYRTLNDPGVTLSRYPLLRALYDQGMNSFNVYKLGDDYSKARFPVFLRRTDDHRGPKTGLLRSPQDLRAALDQLKTARENLDDWLVTEYCNVSDSRGIFRKYYSFFVGQTIIPRHLFFGSDWVQKHSKNIGKKEFHDEELGFLNNNDYQDQLQLIFKTANIQFGRIDFGVVDGRVQTWEINTNPMIITHSHVKEESRMDIHRLFFQRFSSAFQSMIDHPPTSPSGLEYWPDHCCARFHCLIERNRFSPLGKLIQKILWRLERQGKKRIKSFIL